MYWRSIQAASSVLGYLWARVVRTRRAEMLHRVSERLSLQRQCAARVTDGVYRSLAHGLALVLLARWGKHLCVPVEVRGYEHMTELHASSKGFVVVTAHFGVWELLTRLDMLCSIEGVFVSKRFRWRPFQFLLRIVRRQSIKVVNTHGSGREILRSLRRGEAAGFAVDQHSNDASALPLEVLGHTAWVTTAPARLARMADVPLVPIRTFWEEDRHVIEIQEPLRYDWTSSKQVDIEHATVWYTRMTERWIREKPEQWLWLHRRWKPRRLGTQGGMEGRG